MKVFNFFLHPFFFISKGVSYLINKITYKKFGTGAYIVRPMRIVNKKCISIGSHVLIRDAARIEPVTEYAGTRYTPLIKIGAKTMVEQGLHISCSQSVAIGENCLISSYVFITDTNHNYEDINIPISFQSLSVKPTIIGNDSFIGTGAKIMAGVTIGIHCVIGSNAVVTHDIPDYCIAVGIPAIIIKRYNSVSLAWEKTDEFGNFIK